MNHVRVGIVGTSWWADEMHLPNLRSHPGARITGICGRNRERAEAMARKYAIPAVYSDYREMIASGGLDALVVSTPDDLHYPITMAALEAGLHVLCEKPLALKADQAREMADKAAAKGVKTMVFFTLRGLPVHRYVKALLDAGYIGRCYHCTIQHFIGYGRSGGLGWRFDPQRGLGALGDLGSHAIDLAHWYVGPIVGVSAQLGRYVARRDADAQPVEAAWDAALLSVRFAGGAQGVIQVSTVGHVGERGIQHQITLHGEKGTLEVGISLNNLKIRGIRDGKSRFRGLPVPARFWGAADRSNPFSVFTYLSVGDRLFIDAILNDQEISPDFAEGARVQEVIEAAITSERDQAWISTFTSSHRT
ncbi:MAG TPA: Gfo/Idh/MocA family oxidoreductase [Chthonomonadaceae bacterium]|nr:Gfo/Idh/MocA family oxidoreductase [Chthonomonadaceae bacterium]